MEFRTCPGEIPRQNGTHLRMGISMPKRWSTLLALSLLSASLFGQGDDGRSVADPMEKAIEEARENGAFRPQDELSRYPKVALVRTETPPEIDGRLNEEVWQQAAVITEFKQVVPMEGAEPSEKTEVRILYDSDFLYLGIRCFDRETREHHRDTDAARRGSRSG